MKLMGSDLVDRDGIFQKKNIILKQDEANRKLMMFDCAYKQSPIFVPHTLSNGITYPGDLKEHNSDIGVSVVLDRYILLVAPLEVLLVENPSNPTLDRYIEKINSMFNGQVTVRKVSFEELLYGISTEAVHQHVFFRGNNEKMWILSTNPGYYFDDSNHMKFLTSPSSTDEYNDRDDKRRMTLNALIDEEKGAVRLYKFK